MADIKQAIEYAKQNPQSAFATELRSRIESGKMNKELQAAGLPTHEGGYLSRVKEQVIGNVKEATQSELASGETMNPLAAGVNIAKNVSNAVLSPVSQALKPAFDKTIAPVSNAIVKTEPVQRVIDIISKHPDLAGVVADTLETGLNVAGIEGTASGLQSGVDAVKGAPETIANKITPELQKFGKNIAQKTEGIRGVGSLISESASRIPSRIATNLAEKQAVSDTIKSLPTKEAQDAAFEGISVPDVEAITKIPESQKAPFRKLVDVVKKFAKGETKTNPIEVIGKPFMSRIKYLDTLRTKVGQQLGDVANGLSKVSKTELLPEVFGKLKKVSGLAGLKIKNGLLDFKDTVLSSQLTKADRTTIQKIFTDAIKDGTGKSKHLLRQELFEILGGKKRSLSNITDTQESAFQAIREGLSDVLEGKNGQYKKLSNQYRKIVEPLQGMRKLMKNVAGAGEDILDMSAGLLARRITSFAKSNPEIRNILRKLDAATKVKGKTLVNVEALQDFYNILDKYYDIAGKTGFQSQVTAGIEKASGIKDLLLQKVREVAGTTEATRTKALESLLDSVLR